MWLWFIIINLRLLFLLRFQLRYVSMNNFLKGRIDNNTMMKKKQTAQSIFHIIDFCETRKKLMRDKFCGGIHKFFGVDIGCMCLWVVLN